MRLIKNVRKGIIEYKEFLFFVLCLLAGILYAATKNTFIGSCAVVWICAAVFLLPPQKGFLLVFGLQFVNAVLPLQLASSSFGFVLPVYGVLTLRFFLERERLEWEQVLLIGIFVLDATVSALNGIYKLGDNLNWVFSLLYVVYILKHYADSVDFEKLFLYFVLAQWTICLVNIVAEIQLFGKSLIPNMYGSWTTDYGYHAFGNGYKEVAGGNGISLNNAVAIALCVMMFPKTKKFALKAFYAVSILFLGYCGIMVIGRGFYVEIALFAGMFVLINTKLKKPKLTRKFAIQVLAICAVGLIALGIVYKEFISLAQTLISRFQEGNGNRENLIFQGQQTISGDVWVLLFGAGSYYPDIYGFTVHNHFWDVALSLGVVGGFVYWLILLSLLGKILFKYGRVPIKAWIPFVMLLVFRFISGSVRDVSFYYYLALCALFAVYITKQEKNMEEKRITVLTPTYNRGYTLERLYASLTSQTRKDFTWLVVDDGSTDGTKALVEGWIKENVISISYVYQENQGKYVAHNTGVKLCETELLVCVDSDDELYPNAVERTLAFWEERKAEERLAGIVSPKDMNGASYFKNPPKQASLSELYQKGKLVGETMLVFKTQVLREFLFPEIAGEKFMAELVVYNQIDQRYVLAVQDEYLYKAEYQADGLTRNMDKIQWKNAMTTLIMYKSVAAYQASFLKAAKAYGAYLAWRSVRKLPKWEPYKVSVGVRIVGFVLSLHYQKLFKKQRNENGKEGV